MLSLESYFHIFKYTSDCSIKKPNEFLHLKRSIIKKMLINKSIFLCFVKIFLPKCKIEAIEDFSSKQHVFT